MTIRLDHTIIPTHDKQAGARFFADAFGLTVAQAGPFAAVRVNAEFTLDFDDSDPFEPYHLGFLVTDAEFDAILGRIAAAGIPHGSGPEAGWDGQVYHRNGGRGVYFQDPNGHSYEIFTAA